MENEEKVSVKEEVVSCLNSISKYTAITTTAEGEKNVESAVDSTENEVAKKLPENTVDEENGADSDSLENEQLAHNIEVDDQITMISAPYQSKLYGEQLELKKKRINIDLERLTKTIRDVIPETDIVPSSYTMNRQKSLSTGMIFPFIGVIASPVFERYLNKLDFFVGVNPETELLTIGFHYEFCSHNTETVGPIHHHAFIPDAMKTAVQLFENHFRSSGRKGYAPLKDDPSGFWRQLLLRTNLDGQILAVVMVHPQDLTSDDMEEVKTNLRSMVEGTQITSLFFQAIKYKPAFKDEWPNDGIEHLSGSKYLLEKLRGLELAISPLASFPVNTLAAEFLLKEIGELAQVDSDTILLDVCCGTGEIGLSLSKICRRVFGVELIPSAVEDAISNAKRNGISNCSYVEGRVEDHLAGWIMQIKEGADNVEAENKNIVAIANLPRAGKAALLKTSVKILRASAKVKRIIFFTSISLRSMYSFADLLCRPQSKIYEGVPFVPVKAVAVDLVPGAIDCELIVLFERLCNLL